MAKVPKGKRAARRSAKTAKTSKAGPGSRPGLEAQMEELKKANEELSRERAALRERAGVIEKRYTELMERTARSEPRPAPQVPDAELQSLRQQLDQSRREREEASKTKGFWMVCPKCGGKLEEVEHENAKVERCRACAGIYLDKGELETIVSTNSASGIFQSLRGLFS